MSESQRDALWFQTPMKPPEKKVLSHYFGPFPLAIVHGPQRKSKFQLFLDRIDRLIERLWG